MEKSDQSIHNICIASIKRSTRKPYDFKWTRFYEESADFKNSFPEIEIELSDSELVICSTVIDKDNFSVLTTQKLITKENGILCSGDFNNAIDKGYGDFKGYVKFNEYKREPLTFGLIQLNNGNELKYFIETGSASMVMIHGVRTKIQTEGMTNVQVDRVANIWTRKLNKE
ncbi:hypothetical protein GO495_00735 [Chitinophaga oryziterrae]|uniref:Uncharacterized protein n=1 Tax=Chitinophaga oryziterrae TaxID=1031224 RepID=A0A6N8J247_9BACT|nr:hypothetical protein [Chitinophaga oryziterrae]MVT39093.1 hypothetical protein [Chitinophaga oryziterrae]